MEKKLTLREKVEEARKNANQCINDSVDKMEKMHKTERARAEKADSEEEAETIMEQLLIDLEKEHADMKKKIDGFLEPFEKDLGIGKYKKTKE